MFIADNKAMQIVNSKGMHAVFEEDRTKPKCRQTRADILADLSCVRSGDRIFFYNQDDTAFWGIYEATSKLFLDRTPIEVEKPAPYRVNLRPFLSLKVPVAEHYLFTRKDAARDFRSIFFKKSLGKGKACTHLFPDETDSLTKILLMQNDSIPDVRSTSPIKPPNLLTPEFQVNGNKCSLEKELEWWLTYHLDSHPECRKIFGDPAGIEMFANYVPITISGGNIDLVVYHQKDVAGVKVRNMMSIVELKRGSAGLAVLHEIENYVRWFIQNITGVESASIIQPIIIASDFKQEVIIACKHWNLCDRKPRLFQYKATSTKDINFTRVN